MVLLVDGRIAIAELAGVLDLDGDAGVLLEQVFAHEGRVVARAARRQDDALDLAQPLRIEVQSAEMGTTFDSSSRPRSAFSSASGCS